LVKDDGGSESADNAIGDIAEDKGGRVYRGDRPAMRSYAEG